MSRTVTALYDTRAEAESAKQRLEGSFDTDSVKIIDQSSHGDDADRGSFLSNTFGSHDDRHAYDEGIRRGSFLLCAEVDSDEDEQRIVSVLEQTSSVDLDQRQTDWRNDGWQPHSGAQNFSQAGSFDQSGSDLSNATERATQEEHIPIVEEQLRVGKRTVSHGGARVRSYVEEVPVEESVSLREEHVSVERRPVDQRLGAADLKDESLFRDRTIEMTETAEEAVVDKEARIKEELVISKTATEHTEQVHDTVRHTEVDVDEGLTGTDRTSPTGNPGAFGFDKNR
jgi:uncharacterized protein (TIGR02271 family)